MTRRLGDASAKDAPHVTASGTISSSTADPFPILHEVKGRERERPFVYAKYLAIPNERTEPIR